MSILNSHIFRESKSSIMSLIRLQTFVAPVAAAALSFSASSTFYSSSNSLSSCVASAAAALTATTAYSFCVGKFVPLSRAASRSAPPSLTVSLALASPRLKNPSSIWAYIGSTRCCSARSILQSPTPFHVSSLRIFSAAYASAFV